MKYPLKNKLKIFFIVLFLFGNAYSYSQIQSKEKKIDSYPLQTSLDVNDLEDYYLIGPGDVLTLKIYDAEEFSGDFSVLNDGTIHLPLIGSVYVTNLSLNQASEKVKEIYKRELLRPELYLGIKSQRPVKVSIIGEVERPGMYSLTTNETTQTDGGPVIKNSGLPTIVEALRKAGGITQNANLKDLVLIRRLPGNKNEYKQASINLIELLLVGDQNQNQVLFDGDIIKISKARIIPDKLMELAVSNLSPKSINVRIIGEVKNPGKFKLESNTPLVNAIYQAGGPTDWKSNRGNVELIRVRRNGSAFRKKFKLNLDQDISNELNPPLSNNDIVRVYPSTFGKVTKGLNEVAQPVSSLVTGLTLIKLLN